MIHIFVMEMIEGWSTPHFVAKDHYFHIKQVQYIQNVIYMVGFEIF